MVTIDDKIIVLFGREQNLQSNHTQTLLRYWIDFFLSLQSLHSPKPENWYHPPSKIEK